MLAAMVDCVFKYQNVSTHNITVSDFGGFEDILVYRLRSVSSSGIYDVAF